MIRLSSARRTGGAWSTANVRSARSATPPRAVSHRRRPAEAKRINWIIGQAGRSAFAASRLRRDSLRRACQAEAHTSATARLSRAGRSGGVKQVTQGGTAGTPASQDLSRLGRSNLLKGVQCRALGAIRFTKD
jgi:hypothetical protein